MTKLDGPRSPMVKMCSPEIETDEYPSPRPAAFQMSGGPALGQSFRRPVAVQRSSRLGPRQPGQSAADTLSRVAVSRREVSPIELSCTPVLCIKKSEFNLEFDRLAMAMVQHVRVADVWISSST